MANPIDLSSATTAEGQFLQLASVLSNAELAQVDSEGDPITDNIQITFDGDTQAFSITATLPAEVASTANGVIYTASTFIAA